ncbi:auxin transport protein BIG-like isoform X1 [Cucurbita moschata]|uniref:Auxin transport protein BIG n=1 Tax=Cucurbita moschata TaxID=3662 RepID=A0A6J1FGF6_CUCMO|nr:auxin transport protein BIG-like isoform X1 [Cucurbita moschata]
MAEQSLVKLIDTIFLDDSSSSANTKKPFSSSDLLQLLRSDDSSFKLGLRQFYSILKAGLRDLGDGKLAFQSWNDSQIQAVCSIAHAIASASRALTVDQAEAIVVAVIKKSLELLFCYLEKSEFKCDDFSIQNNMLLIMETILVDGMDKVSDCAQLCAKKGLIELLKFTGADCDVSIEFDNHIECGFAEGVCCSREEKQVGRLLMTIAAECVQADQLTTESGFSEPTFLEDINKLILFCQHWAITHLACIQRLILICKELVILPDVLDEKTGSTSFRKRLSCSLRILKLLTELSKKFPCIEYDAKLMQAFALFANSLPCLFGLCFEFANSHAIVEGSFENTILLLLEEYLELVKVVFRNSYVCVNIQTCIVASILDNLSSSVWRHDASIANLKPPLVYFPRSVMVIIKLIQDLKGHKYHAFSFNDLEMHHTSTLADLSVEIPKCHARLEIVPLQKNYTVEEILRMIFPPSKQWMDDLMHLLFFLYSEGVRLRPKIERSLSSCMKSSSTVEQETSVCHEDEALFGDLFSESGRSVGSVDGYDLHHLAVNSTSSFCNLLLQAAKELLSFIKQCIFSPEWSASVFDDGCNKLDQNHIDILISLLNCEGFYSDDRSSASCVPAHDEKKSGHIHEICYRLLHGLLTRHVLPDYLEEYLVKKILNAENGNVVYNDQTLSLLANTLFCRTGTAGTQLRTQIYRQFVEFIAEKAKTISLSNSSLQEFIGTLPSVFHIEILLVAFHLSSEEEKREISSLIFSSIRTIDAPSTFSNSTELSMWGLLVSRLIIVLRYVIFHPHTCSSSLLFDFRSKLRDAPAFSSSFPYTVNDHLSSWGANVAKNIIGSSMESEPFFNGLINQLIDISSFPASLRQHDLTIECPWFNPGEIFSTFSWILGFWNGKQAVTVEDLIIERYIFVLCWDFPYGNALSHGGSLWSDPETLDISNTTCFFYFSYLLLDHSDIIGESMKFPQVVIGLLRRLHGGSILEDFKALGWSFLRNGAWLSLILSFLSVGILRYCSKNTIPTVGSFLTDIAVTDIEQANLAGSLISSVITDNQVSILIRELSSVLSMYLQVYQKAFVATLSSTNDHASEFSPLLLFKHSEFDRCVQNKALENYGTTSCVLESVFKLMSRLDEIVDKRALGFLSRASWESMFHGFPSHLETSSGILLSCVLSIGRIISVLAGLLGIVDVKRNIILETEVTHGILDAVMTIKFDKTFEKVHGLCEGIYQSLSVELEGCAYGVLFLLKQLEGYLRHINMSGASDSTIHEWVIVKATDIIDNLRKDASKSSVFQFYFGAEVVPEQVREFYGSQHGNLLVLLDSLDNCCSELVNLKVLGFFVELLSGEPCPKLKLEIQNKFLSMDLHGLSKWLEKRILGSVAKDSSGVNVKGSSISLRESSMNFVFCLISSPSEPLALQLQSHIFEAALVSLDLAFLRFDISVANSYFHFVVQLLRGEKSMKLLLERILVLMEKLASDERLLPGLKYLFSFLEMILIESGSGKNVFERASGKPLSRYAPEIGPLSSKSVGPRKNSETLVLSSNQEDGRASFECDATSGEEDEDDGTSDGEVASLDKDEDEDTNSERALASKVCTFTSSGSNFMEQHWYFCYTCDLTVSKGCCSVCAKVCHRGHRVVYSRSSRFFCDCGAGGVRGSSCQCLKPRKFTGHGSTPVRGASNFQCFLPFCEEGDQLPESESDLEDDVVPDTDKCLKPAVPRELLDGVSVLLEKLDVEGRMLELCSCLLPSITNQRDPDLSKDKKIILGKDKVLSYGLDLLQLKKAYKGGSLDLKIKAEYANAKELKSHLASGSLVKSLLSVSIRGRLAVGEGDKVSIFDVRQLIEQATVAPMTADKTNVKPLSKNVVRFEIVHLAFNPTTENYLAVAGFEDFQVLTLNHRGEVVDRLAIELALQGAHIKRMEWVPGSQVQLMVVTNKFVKIYDLSLDNISPMHYFTLPDDMVVDATLFTASQGRMFLIVLSENGRIFRFELSVLGNVGATLLKETIHIQGREMSAKGLSLYFSSCYKLLFVAYADGTTLVGQMSPDATKLSEISVIYEEDQDRKLRPAGLYRWKELFAGSGLFVCFSSVKSNSALAISMGAHEIYAQNLRHAGGSSFPLVGITAYKPLSKDKIHCLLLHDDGSLQIYTHTTVGVDASANATAEKIKKLGSGILNNKVYASANPEFPLDFFEKTVCITADVRLGGDAIRNGDSEGAKQSLASEDGFLESPSSSDFKITVSNSNPDIVMVGFRIHVGNMSANHIPSEISIFQRVIKLDEGMRSWYDIPFTVAESLLADEEFTITVGPAFNGTALPRIDSLEVYGRAKDEFGWKEKLDAILDMEARALGSNSLVAKSGKKRRSIQCAPIQQQVLADGLKVLSSYYLLRRSQGCPKLDDVNQELDKLKCKQLLETIYESDREPLLQSAACRVLQAIFPKKEIYYQVKDTMRLTGVVKSASLLSSRLGVGDAAAGWIIEEFTSQMHAVSKIALHRRSNLACFLERNGSQVVDGLMQILWGILDLEQPNTQTLNNIVISSVELIYCYAECLALHGPDTGRHSVAPAVVLFKKLLFSSSEAVQTSSSLAISSRLLQVPFPKQTMLATDDGADIPLSAPISTEATGTHPQVMIEEDSITSSVQYCCDGCSTVPILRRRWHCTICPDFDLCESCYEVLDADRLPSPHSRDHPMTAIPIEVESLGDGNEYHFSTEDINDSSLTSLRSDISVKNPVSSIHVLGPADSGDFSASVTDPVSISASKQTVNSLLLSELLEQLKGWMETTSGVQAVPIMQLFYRLSSTMGGPFMNSLKSENLDLERLIKWFLDEINLNKPFEAKTRTSFGEVAILVFMFFTLMLRNWHQPGSDGPGAKPSTTADTHDKSSTQVAPSTSVTAQSSVDDQGKNDFTSQLLRACGSIRQQSFVNYLMDVLQQLVHVFKSSSIDYDSGHGFTNGSGCGALLTVRKDLPAGNFSPFFSDSYAKAHRTDLFVDYHRLLLENAFRLVYTLVRPEKYDKTLEKEKAFKIYSSKDLKLDVYQDVLCSYINNPNTSFVRRYARRLFLHICGSKSHYYSIRDSWQFSTEEKKLFKYINKVGGFQIPMSYERSVKIVKCLTTMAEVAAARPRNWQKYCLRHGDVLPFLLNGVFYFGEESVIQTLKLLNLAFYTGKDIGHSVQKSEAGDAGTSTNKSGTQTVDSRKKRKGEDGNDSALEKSYLDMEAMVNIFVEKDNNVLSHFIDCFLLEWNSSSIRAEAKGVVCGVWHHGKQTFKETLLMALLQKVKTLPMYGLNIAEYTELVTWLLGKVPDVVSKQQSSELLDRCLTSDVIRSIYQTLHSQNELLANHPNSRMYNTLSGLVEFDGYYLESEPCAACSSPEVPYSRMKLESLKSETKFTDNRIIVKCTGSYTIQTVIMNVHDARKSKSVKVLNLYYNNRPVADLSELKNNWSLWKRAKSCHLAFNQTELKVEFPIPITACNFMIELDSFYENLQALSLEPLQCPRCSRPVTDRHGICSNCHENAYQCRQCRNINYENLDSFLCNECGYSKYGRFEFNFMAKPSFTFDNMENDEDMKRGLAAIESESENAHRRYQQLLGYKKPLLKIVSSIGENEMDSQQKDSVQQMMVSLPGPSCKINRKIALLGVLYGEKCKAAFDSVSKSVQTLQGLRRALMTYLHQKHTDDGFPASRFVISRSPNNCYGCATTFVTQCLEILQVLSKHRSSKKQLVNLGILSELFENNIHQGPKTARIQARAVLCSFSESDVNAVSGLNDLIQKKVMYCLEHHRSMDIALATREELSLLSEVCSLADEFWEARLRVVFQLLFSSIKSGAKHPAIAEHIILPCLRIISQACTPPKSDTVDKEQRMAKLTSVSQNKDENSKKISGSSSGPVSGSKSASESLEHNWDSSQRTQDIQLLSYAEWEKGASYLDFVRRQYKVSQVFKGTVQRHRTQKGDYLCLKYALKWKRFVCRNAKSDLSAFELGSWVTELVLCACSQSIRSEMCMLISLLCAQSSSRRFRLLDLLVSLLPATLSAGESVAEYFELLFKMVDSEDARLFLTVRGCLRTICQLISQEVSNVESLERSLHIDISQGFILHKLIELLGKFLEIPNIRSRFMRDNLLSEVLEALIVIRGLVVQKTKLISDCNQLLKDLLDSLLLESNENKKQFIRACICGLQIHGAERKGRTCLFILEQLCNLISPSKPEPVYLLVLNKAHTQEEFIRGSMTKNPYSSAEIGPLMRDIKNKICHQLDLLGFLEDDYGMELLVAGNIIALDLSIALVYEQVWKKSNQSSSAISNTALISATAARDSSPMTVTYRLQGLDGEATEPMIKELEEDREESQDPELEFAIAGAVREYGGLEILLAMIQRIWDNFKSNQEQLVAVLNLLMHCCKIRENRRALLRLGALGLLLETARRAFSVDAMESAEGILLIVESLTIEANESESISIGQSALTITSEQTGTGEQAKKIVLMFLERLSHPFGYKKSNKQQRNTEMVARILPYLTYGEPAAMDALIQHFTPYLNDWDEFDRLQKQHEDNPEDKSISEQAAKQRFTVENFVRVSESLKTSSCGERLKDIILEKGITGLAVKHLRDSFAVAGQASFRSSMEWAFSLKRPSIPLILSMLRGLSMGHLATQRCIDEGRILPVLHALERVPGENEIGARAENLLDTLSKKEGNGDGFLEDKVRMLRHATKDEMRRLALKNREHMLQVLGMELVASDGGERIVVSRPALEGLEDVKEEEDGLACMVCREGYSLRPTDLLGVYSYSKRVNLGVGISGSSRGECVYTTVSYFNIIHYQCHQEAKRTDAGLKIPKKEWEGATLRNNESLCNSLFPVRGPSVPSAQYMRYVDQHWDNLNALGRADGNRLRLLTYDIVLMLARFATGASFSAESRGGGRESNSKFLPFMLQMARHLLDQGSPSQRITMAKSVSIYLSSSIGDLRPFSPGSQPSAATEETVQFMMVNSLLSESYESWLLHRRAFLQRGIFHAYMQHTHSRSTNRSSASSTSKMESGSNSPNTEAEEANDLLATIKPMLVYTGLIQQLQHFFKVKKLPNIASCPKEGTSTSTSATATGEESETQNLEGWEVVMKERLNNVKGMVGFSKELLTWLEEMNSATDLQEAFDVIGVLADVLSDGISRCEDFVHAAINTGKG